MADSRWEGKKTQDKELLKGIKAGKLHVGLHGKKLKESMHWLKHREGQKMPGCYLK